MSPKKLVEPPAPAEPRVPPVGPVTPPGVTLPGVPATAPGVPEGPPEVPTRPPVVPVVENAVTKFKDLVSTFSLDGEAKMAFAYCMSKFTEDPIGKAVQCRGFQDIVDTAMPVGGKAEARTPCLFSGSFKTLAVDKPASPEAVDSGRVLATLQKVENVHDLKGIIGQIIINSSGPGPLSGMHRGNKDAEILAACLLAYWMQSPDSDNAFKEVFNDLIFDAAVMGIDSKFKSSVFLLYQAEEKARETLGMSAYRLCMHILDQVVQQG